MRVTSRDPTKGILDFTKGLERFQLQRPQPAADLRPWIESYWIVSWDLQPGFVHRQTNLSHASINAAVEEEGTFLYGVPQRTFVRDIAGRGSAFGVKFRPGGFYPFLGSSLGVFAGRRVPLEEVVGLPARQWARAMTSAPNVSTRVALADSFWRELREAAPQRFAEGPTEATLIAEGIISDRRVLSVAVAAERAGVSVRTLERVFNREVGIGPKEVIRRFRLQEAAERLLRRPDISSGEIALDLGYADQAHFIREFKSVVGVTPDVYRQRQHP